MPPRKPSPARLTREDVTAMIAEAVAAERARSEQAMAGVMLALGGAAQALDRLGDAVEEAGRTLDLHAGLIEPMARAFAAGMDLDANAAAPDAAPH